MINWTLKEGQKIVSNCLRKEGACLSFNIGMIKKMLGYIDIKITIGLLSWIELIMVFTQSQTVKGNISFGQLLSPPQMSGSL